MKQVRHYKIGIVVAVISLLGFVSFLLTSNYLSQRNLQQTLLDRFRIENETQAGAISYFFNDRREDLRNLAASREVSVFFENRALGMSMEYGLKQSLPPIKNLFLSLIDRVNRDRRSAYLRIMMVDETGELLVHVAGQQGGPAVAAKAQKYIKDSHVREGAVLAEDGNRSIIITVPYHFKGRHAGQILAWIDPRYVSDHIVGSIEHPGWRWSLASAAGIVYTPLDPASACLLEQLSPRPFRFRERLDGQEPRDMIGMAATVSKTPFLLVSCAPAKTVLGGLEPGRLLTGMCILALVIIGGGLAMVRTMTRTLKLQTMLDASWRHERQVSEKNNQLEREIAERKQAEEALRDSEDRYRTLVEASPDVIFTLSLQGGIIRSLNPAFESVTGWTRPEWLDRHFIDIVHADDRPLVLNKYREATNGAGVMRYDVRCLTSNGSYRIVELTTAPLLQHGAVTGRLGIARDITERTALEEQLRQAAKMQAIGQLAGGIAHDFNNILSIIIGGCDVVLMDMQERDPGRSTIQMVLNAAERGAQVTRNLLTFSRKQVVRTQVRDLNEIILSAEPLIAQLIREDIRFSVDLTNERLPCIADGTQIEQVLMNLTANARDALTEGGRFSIGSRRITMDEAFIRSRGFGRVGEYAALRLEDTGSGMDETTRQRIFEPFFTTKGVGKGTGLGLASVFGIVKQHNGYIDVKSQLGSGTVFSIYLPLVSDSPAATGTQPSALRLGGTGTLLVAEDEALVRNVITQILTRAGYRVIEACDGEDAESKFREQEGEIDLVLLDVIMPKKNGKQAYESIQKMRPGMKCLFMSGYTGDIISNSGISATEADFLQKPVPPPLLLMKVREMLGGAPIQ